MISNDIPIMAHALAIVVNELDQWDKKSYTAFWQTYDEHTHPIIRFSVKAYWLKYGCVRDLHRSWWVSLKGSLHQHNLWMCMQRDLSRELPQFLTYVITWYQGVTGDPFHGRWQFTSLWWLPQFSVGSIHWRSACLWSWSYLPAKVGHFPEIIFSVHWSKATN